MGWKGLRFKMGWKGSGMKPNGRRTTSMHRLTKNYMCFWEIISEPYELWITDWLYFKMASIHLQQNQRTRRMKFINQLTSYISFKIFKFLWKKIIRNIETIPQCHFYYIFFKKNTICSLKTNFSYVHFF